MPEESHFSLRDGLSLFYRKINLFKITLVVFPLVVLIACLVVPPVYESTAKVIVTGKQENATLLQVPSEKGTSAFLNLNVDETDLNSEMELLKSVDLWMRTVRKLGLKSLKKEEGKSILSPIIARMRSWKAELVGGERKGRMAKKAESVQVLEQARTLMKDLKVTPVTKSKVLDISFRYSDPTMAQKILSTFLDEYIPYHQQVYSVPGAQGFFTNQEEMFFARWQEAQRKVKDFRAKWGISFADKQRSELISQIKQIEDSLVDITSNLSQYRKMLAQLKTDSLPTGQLSSSPQRGTENTVISVIATQLFRAKQQLLLVKESFSPESREYRDAESLVQKVTQQFANTLETEIGILAAKRASLDQSLKSRRGDLKALERNTEELRNLQLAATIAKERYIQYSSKKEDARAENVKGGRKLVNVSILAKPFTPVVPVFPKTALMVLGAFLLAIPLGIGLILVANFLDHTFDSPTEVENVTGLPVLATLRRLPKTEGAGAS